MTATIPTHCPHGSAYYSDLLRLGVHERVGVRFTDDCWTTVSTDGPRRFWCGLHEMSKPAGTSVTEGEYLAAWDEALEMAADRTRAIDLAHGLALEEENARWLRFRKSAEDSLNYLRDWSAALEIERVDHLHEQALALNVRQECLVGNEHVRFVDGAEYAFGPDNPEHSPVSQAEAEETHPDTPETREYLRSLYDGPVIGAIIDYLAAEHAEYLGEVPWTDRVEEF